MYNFEANTTLNWIITAIIGSLTLYLVWFYLKVFKLPSGPFPYPFVGNVLIFRGTKVNQFLTIAKLKEKYGPVFTVWLGNTPIVFVSDLELLKESFNNTKNSDIMGRANNVTKKLMLGDTGTDVLFTDHGPTWASLRRVAHLATRKLATSEKLLDLVNNSVDQTVNEILSKEGKNKPFDIVNYMYLMMYNVIASSVFGKSYSIDDPEFNFLKDSFEYFRHNNKLLILVDTIPFLKPIYYKTFTKVAKTLTGISKKITEKYVEHLADNQKGIIRDVCDGLIEAKEEAIAERKESAPDFVDNNLALVIFDLFVAGTETTIYTMRWIMLLMANNIDMQKRMREEIDSVIGDRMATHDDKNSCVYVHAFILETLRYRPVVPTGVLHRAMCDTNIGNYKIPVNTLVSSFIWNVHQDPQYWPKPHEFNPQRFISSDGKSVNAKHAAFIPFGIGRRVCLGEKLALEDLFLLTVRLLQSTLEYLFALPNGEGTANLEPEPNIIFLSSPNPYKIMLK